MESKERFLKNKGLTDPEIRRAIEKWTESLDVPTMTSELMFFQQNRKNWFRDHILPIIIYGGFAYAAYWVYKNCLRNLLFVDQPKKKTTSECLEELRKSIDVLNSNIAMLRTEVQGGNQSNSVATVHTQLDNIKSDINSIKGILLNRNQFPSLKTRTEPPSIPAWQRQSEEATSAEPPNEEKPKPLRTRSQRSESGGSNSSEGEHGTKNSDSSLEIM
ncbi:Peroxisomal membrane protein PEX14 [Eumeta japonica]|uniref:Peroxisomal membrane protein PEX14 n=1 Tax=Eumeta variegata TaxID=151549 RepID=A0A4C1U5W4_EUMVA|nr:Peroxisomal membrane protein PEX14 [Eumeta japonica]